MTNRPSLLSDLAYLMGHARYYVERWLGLTATTLVLCRGRKPSGWERAGYNGSTGEPAGRGSSSAAVLGSEVHQWSRKHRAWGRRR